MPYTISALFGAGWCVMSKKGWRYKLLRWFLVRIGMHSLPVARPDFDGFLWAMKDMVARMHLQSLRGQLLLACVSSWQPVA